MAFPRNTIIQGDCVQQLQALDAGHVDLAFADPPFNIGYEYDVYEDRRQAQDYLDWCRQWICEIRRVLKPTGSFWLAIGDEFAAELKLIAQNDARFSCRSWIIWYYTFGVNCARGFSRSHTHLFHFVCDPRQFTFNVDNPSIRVPSARQLVYADSRANPKGRLPDNTWIYRPQDGPTGSFVPWHDTWYFARVAGTFKEREGFHGCQMPEQLLGRVIRTSSQPRELVLDPFGGSGTTLAVAKKLGRQFLGFELSREYAQRIEARLAQTDVGEPLDGVVDPIQSAPKTVNGRSKSRMRNGRLVLELDTKTERGIIDAYRRQCEQQPVDVVLCRPDLNAAFIGGCKKNGVEGSPEIWNRLLLRLRKSGRLPRTNKSPARLNAAAMDAYSFASEIAMQSFSIDYERTLDDLFCEPTNAAEFDAVARSFAPGFTSWEYRWAALACRKRASRSKKLAVEHFEEWMRPQKRLPSFVPLEAFAPRDASKAGVYWIANEQRETLYVGETLNIAQRMEQAAPLAAWQSLGARYVAWCEWPQAARVGLQAALIERLRSFLNSDMLRPHHAAIGRRSK